MTGNSDFAAGTRTTIKDISYRLGISHTTVHRALTGKPGLSDALRQRIQDTAREMGYEINYAASSIKRRPLRVAVVMPQDDGSYFGNIWRGILQSAEEVRRLNVTVETYICEDESHECQILKQIANAGPDEYAGVMAFSYARMPEVIVQLQRLVDQKIATFMVDDVLEEPAGVFSLPAHQADVGLLAGEIASLMLPDRGTVIVTEARVDSKIHVDKLTAFREYVHREKPEINIVTVSGYSTQEETDGPVRENILKALREHDDVALVYAQTSGDTRLLLNLLRQMPERPSFRVIGTDLNDNTAKALENGELTLVIDQGSFMKGYTGMSLLVDNVVKHIAPPHSIDSYIDVIYRSNLRSHERIKLKNNGGKSK